MQYLQKSRSIVVQSMEARDRLNDPSIKTGYTVLMGRFLGPRPIGPGSIGTSSLTAEPGR
jgi:hypothetical protein